MGSFITKIFDSEGSTEENFSRYAWDTVERNGKLSKSIDSKQPMLLRFNLLKLVRFANYKLLVQSRQQKYLVAVLRTKW